MQLFNTLSRKIEDFKPNGDLVKLYTCGPTVYDAAHIGNLRAYIFGDTLKRVLISNDFKVKHAMNITDVDDKTIKKSGGKFAEFEKLTQAVEEKFWADFDALANTRPDAVPHATEYIDKIVTFIESLLAKGLAYKAEDGSVYFSIAKFPSYGQLSGLDLATLKTGARVCQDEYTKENPADFVLWKAWDEADGEIFWDPSTWLRAGTALGKGRPGWSIECSVMSTDILGNTLDIHTGGVDLIFPHHENEIAQSEGYSGQKFVNFWLHNEHLLVSGEKMAKSAGNYYVLDDLVKKGFEPLAFRYLCLGAHYRSKMNFTWEALEGAQKTLNSIRDLISRDEKVDLSSDIEQKITKALDHDLDTPKALALLHEAKSSALWLKLEPVLGLKLEKKSIKLTPAQEALIKERNEARKAGQYEKADAIRKQLAQEGVVIEDTKTGEHILTKT